MFYTLYATCYSKLSPLMINILFQSRLKHQSLAVRSRHGPMTSFGALPDQGMGSGVFRSQKAQTLTLGTITSFAPLATKRTLALSGTVLAKSMACGARKLQKGLIHTRGMIIIFVSPVIHLYNSNGRVPGRLQDCPASNGRSQQSCTHGETTSFVVSVRLLTGMFVRLG